MEGQDDEATLCRLRMDLMVRVGTTLLNVQITERALRFITTFVLQKSSPITAEQIIAQSNAEQKKTLGYFLAELRKRVDLDVHFDRTFAEFLRRRNLLAHHLSDLPGWKPTPRTNIHRTPLYQRTRSDQQRGTKSVHGARPCIASARGHSDVGRTRAVLQRD
jgi:hypothetical protein